MMRYAAAVKFGLSAPKPTADSLHGPAGARPVVSSSYWGSPHPILRMSIPGGDRVSRYLYERDLSIGGFTSQMAATVETVPG